VVTQQGPCERTPIGKSSFLGHAQIDGNNNFTDDRIITTANGDQIFETAKRPGPVVDALSFIFSVKKVCI
jgi:hypothetical protein